MRRMQAQTIIHHVRDAVLAPLVRFGQAIAEAIGEPDLAAMPMQIRATPGTPTTPNATWRANADHAGRGTGDRWRRAGGHKGAALALIVEVSAARPGWDTASFPSTRR